jgi:hypothetical protein
MPDAASSRNRTLSVLNAKGPVPDVVYERGQVARDWLSHVTARLRCTACAVRVGGLNAWGLSTLELRAVASLG